MIIKSYPPREFHRGLYVTFYDDHKDFFCMTSFSLVLDEPSAPIDAQVLQTCAKLFTYLLTGDINGEGIDYGGSMVTNLLSFSYHQYQYERETAYAKIVDLCERFLNKESLDETVLATLPQYDKAAEVVRAFLIDVQEKGKYTYEEDIT